LQCKVLVDLGKLTIEKDSVARNTIVPAPGNQHAVNGCAAGYKCPCVTTKQSLPIPLFSLLDSHYIGNLMQPMLQINNGVY